MRILMLAAVVLFTARVEAASQTFVELGAAAVRACLMAEASCSEPYAAVGFQLGVWHRDKVALRLRFIEIARPDRRDEFGNGAYPPELRRMAMVDVREFYDDHGSLTGRAR